MIQHGIYLSWNKVSAAVGEKSILKDINGYCNPGGMLAIMGSSGAGKTTLLSILAKKYDSAMKI
jgi:ABC-type multidrug transport system ATPase subunit